MMADPRRAYREQFVAYAREHVDLLRTVLTASGQEHRVAAWRR
jgi:hypothetical protein